MVVYAVWDGVAGVRFPAPRQIQKSLENIFRGTFVIFGGEECEQFHIRGESNAGVMLLCNRRGVSRGAD